MQKIIPEGSSENQQSIDHTGDRNDAPNVDDNERLQGLLTPNKIQNNQVATDKTVALVIKDENVEKSFDPLDIDNYIVRTLEEDMWSLVSFLAIKTKIQNKLGYRDINMAWNND